MLDNLCATAIKYKAVLGFHHGHGTEFKNFYVEGSLDDIRKFENKKILEGWVGCGCMNVSNITQNYGQPPQQSTSDPR